MNTAIASIDRHAVILLSFKPALRVDEPRRARNRSPMMEAAGQAEEVDVSGPPTGRPNPSQSARTSPIAVAAQATSATQIIASATVRSGANSAASDRRRLATAYMPSGKTRLQSIGV